MFQLVFGDLSLTVPSDAIRARCGAFADTRHSPYRVQTDVSPENIRVFAAAIVGDPIDITSDITPDLMRLADEFSFTALQREVSARSLALHVESEYRHFVSELDDHKSHPSHLERLVSIGFEESVSRKMLIVTRGNFDLARAALEALSRAPSELLRFASSTPIHKCLDPEAIPSVIPVQRPTGRYGFEPMFASHGGTLYSFAAEDCYQFSCVIVLSATMLRCPISSDDFPGCPDMALDFFRAQWKENTDHESVFVMEGLSEAAARKLMMLARGRYCLAWKYFRNFEGRARGFLERGILFSQMQDHDSVARKLCKEQRTREHMISLSKVITGSWAVMVRDPAALWLMAAQDAREFFQRNPQLLNQ
jgi:hypothetical protein